MDTKTEPGRHCNFTLDFVNQCSFPLGFYRMLQVLSSRNPNSFYSMSQSVVLKLVHGEVVRK